MDANENIYDKCIRKTLTCPAGLDMKEVVGNHTGKKIGPTYFRGTQPIYGVWATSGITVVGACVMPVGYGIGDHRMFIVDFTMASMTGKDPPRIVRPAARRFNTRIEGCAASYNVILEKDIRKHKLLEKLGEAHAEAHDKPVLNARVNKIDDDSAQYTRHAEKKCRKIKSGRIVFSPEASKWIR